MIWGAAVGRSCRSFAATGAFGYDGNPNTAQQPWCQVCDLATLVQLPRRDWVLSLETGEHIPPEFEDNFLSNIDRHNSKGAVLSWATPGHGGKGHFNERDLDYIRFKFKRLGYVEDSQHSKLICDMATLWYFKKNTMVFRRDFTAEIRP